MKVTTYQITPVTAPRMVKSDSWKKRPCVVRYRAYSVKIQEFKIQLESPFKVTFNMPMPKSWGKKKKREHEGQPHKQTPDLDNLLKGFLDSVYYKKDDAHIWSVNAEKRWAYSGSIEVTQ